MNADYKNFEIQNLTDLRTLIQTHSLDGINVTIPHKINVISLLDALDESAQLAGAVNCIQVKDGKLIGYNTDIIGFELSLTSFIPNNNFKALVFGNGGASKAVQVVLKKMKIEFKVVSRHEEKDQLTYIDLVHYGILKTFKLLINTTPVGMYPNIQERLQIPYDEVGNEHYVFDLIYNPQRTHFLNECQLRGAHVQNGYQMLIEQAEASLEIFLK